MRLANHREEIESQNGSSAVLSIDGAVKLIAGPASTTAAKTRFSFPDIGDERVFFTEGTGEFGNLAFAQIWPSKFHPGSHFVACLDFGFGENGGFITEIRRPMKLSSDTLRACLAAMRFKQGDEWRKTSKDSAPVMEPLAEADA